MAILRELAEIVRLEKGRHRSPQDGVCAMELVAWMAGEKHSDHPRSASPVIAALIRPFNDALDSSNRQRLGVLAERLIGTRCSREQELQRGQMLWDWMMAEAVPSWLLAAGRADIAWSVATGRGAALESAVVAIGAHAHSHVRPVDDDQTAERVGQALAIAGLTGACLAGGDTADALTGARARRHWHSARVLTRTAAWAVAESDPRPAESGGLLWRTAEALRDSTFVLLEDLIGVTEAAPPAPPPIAAAGIPLAGGELAPV